MRGIKNAVARIHPASLEEENPMMMWYALGAMIMVVERSRVWEKSMSVSVVLS
jgi:hypothetical protein